MATVGVNRVNALLSATLPEMQLSSDARRLMCLPGDERIFMICLAVLACTILDFDGRTHKRTKLL